MNSDKSRIISLTEKLQRAAADVKILRNIAWPIEQKMSFFASKCQKLPEVEYPVYDSKPVLDEMMSIQKALDTTDPVDAWIGRIADKISASALLLSSRGQKSFFTHSTMLYGRPAATLKSYSGTTLDLAYRFAELFDSVKKDDLGAPPEACVLARALAEDMTKVVNAYFGDQAPEIVMDPTLASNVLAGRRRVSIRPTASFTDRDIEQLIHHELYVHVATSLNGFNQPYIKILSEGHAGTTKTQEGLAVFAEFITGSLDLDRVRRLSDRVIAIQMAIEGADFIQVYKFFLEKTDNPDQSFENAKRVFRGGIITGGAPFTKDIVYLEGLLQVHTFLSQSISTRHFDYLDLLFCGKMDIADLPVLKYLNEIGLINKPQFMPPWIQDKRFLLSYLTFSSFLNHVDLKDMNEHFERIIN